MAAQFCYVYLVTTITVDSMLLAISASVCISKMYKGKDLISVPDKNVVNKNQYIFLYFFPIQTDIKNNSLEYAGKQTVHQVWCILCCIQNM